MLFIQILWGVYLFVLNEILFSERIGILLWLSYLILCIWGEIIKFRSGRLIFFSLILFLPLSVRDISGDLFWLLFPVIALPLMQDVLVLLFSPESGRFAPGILLVPLVAGRMGQSVEFWFISLLTGAYFFYHLSVSHKLEKLNRDNLNLEQELSSVRKKVQFLGEAGKDRERAVVLEERTRLARRMHDDLGHSLTGAIMQLDAWDLLREDDPEKASEMAKNIKNTLSEGMEKVRLALRVIKPLPADGGEAALRNRLSTFQDKYNIRCSLEKTGEWDGVASGFWDICDQNLQEALTNCLKYGKADRFQMTMNQMNRIYKVEMKDNGSSCGPIRFGMGLEAMDDRVRKMGGTMLVDNSKGFSIIALYPRSSETEEIE